MSRSAMKRVHVNQDHQGVGGSFIRPAPSAVLRTSSDCSIQQNAQDARHQLHRCVTDADFAAWAKRWGEPLANHALQIRF